MSRRRPDSAQSLLPSPLTQDIDRAGYYPALVAQVVDTAVAGEEVLAHLVHQETTFDSEEVRRHITVLVVTGSRLVVAHADDHGPDEGSPTTYASASTEAVPLHQVRTVVLQHLVPEPAQHSLGTLPQELSLTIGWGSVHRLDLEPAVCADPECEADHGYTGSITGDDIVIRVTSAAEGGDAGADALAFARALSAATGGRLPGAAPAPAPTAQ